MSVAESTTKRSRKPAKPRKPKLDPTVPERLAAATPERLWCVGCGLFQTCKTPFMMPFVPKGWTRRLLLVGEAPGEDEDARSGRPFTGRAGRLLRRLYQTAGFGDVDIALVNSVRCRPVDNAVPAMRQVRACRPFLLRTIEVLRPLRVVGLGVVAARALTNSGDVSVTGLRGRILSVPGLQFPVPNGNDALEGRVPENAERLAGSNTPLPAVTATYHPAAVLHGAVHLEKRIVEDLRGDAPRLEYPLEELPPPQKTLGIDLEWSKSGELLTIALADDKRSYAFDRDS